MDLNGNKTFALGAYSLNTNPPAPLARGQKIQVRTAQVGKKVMAVTNDGRFLRFFAAVGCFFKSTADLVYPNSSGKIIIKDHRAEDVRFGPAPVEHAAYWPMSSSTVVEVCNHPNGIYTLQVSAGQKSAEVEYVSGQYFEANSHRRSRGF